MTWHVTLLSPAPLLESQVATKLIESIRAKEEMQAMSEVINSLSSVNPELSLDRNSEFRTFCQSRVSNCIVLPPELLLAKVSLVTQCILYVGSKTISHSFLALTKSV